MHSFIVKFKGGVPQPLSEPKRKLLQKLMKDYEKLDYTAVLTIKVAEKSINQAQMDLYKAFVLKVQDHFGFDDFSEAQDHVKRFYPDEDLPVSKWTSKQLDDFLSKAISFFADFGFRFESK